MEPCDDPLIGQEIANYRVEAVIGFGAMGRVYSAVHPLMGRRAAIKVLNPQLSENVEVVERFLNEARAVNEIRHPNIVEVTDCGQWNGQHYLVMELLVGETLADCIQQSGHLAPEQAVEIGGQIAAALHAAHERGVVHRDLKPDNVFLADHADYPQFVKVLDFGVAKLMREKLDVRTKRTEQGTLLGTPHYMSPEQCLGDQDVAAASDIYSLGILMYEMVTGELPFDANNLAQLLLAHVNQVPTPLLEAAPDTPVHVADAVMAALSKDSVDRPSSMREFRRQLRGEPADEPTMKLVPAVAPANDTKTLAAARTLASPAPAKVRKPARPAQAAPAPPTITTTPQFGLSAKDSARPKRVASKLGRIILEKVRSDKLVLPTMPQVAIECMRVINKPLSDFTEIAATLERDPMLAGQVLRVANSVAFMSTEKARTLAQAIARLGGRQLRTLLIELSAHRVFQSRDPRIRQAFNGIWEHSLAVAVLSRRLCERANRGLDPELAHLAGLLHDVGKPMVGSMLLEAEKRLDATEKSFMSPELWMSVVDDSHRDVGVAVTEAWKMPAEIVETVAECGRFDDSKAHSVRNYVCLANALAKREGFNISSADPTDFEEIVDAGAQLLALDGEALGQLSESLETQVRGRRASKAPASRAG